MKNEKRKKGDETGKLKKGDEKMVMKMENEKWVMEKGKTVMKPVVLIIITNILSITNFNITN